MLVIVFQRRVKTHILLPRFVTLLAVSTRLSTRVILLAGHTDFITLSSPDFGLNLATADGISSSFGSHHGYYEYEPWLDQTRLMPTKRTKKVRLGINTKLTRL